ncbi:hypothetical protein, partial [Aeromonas caviae]|uniref:hypothetical protein n=1 Tax=Aeromonas caviae TaxID=648 RepID=UPI002B467A2F
VLFFHRPMPLSGLECVGHVFTALFCSFTGRCHYPAWNVSAMSSQPCSVHSPADAMIRPGMCRPCLHSPVLFFHRPMP